MHCRRFAVLLGLALALGARAADAPGGRFDRAIVAPSKTSVYVGTVALTVAEFLRTAGKFEATYAAKVFPFFFYNESGRLSVDFSDDQLRRLARGEPVEFSGRAVRDDGAERRVKGKATPADLASGKIKVRVFYSKRIELIFNTTYRFPAVVVQSAPAPSPPQTPGP
jgi:hypothetical protein